MGDELSGGERSRFEVEGAGEASAILVAGEGLAAACAGTRRGSRDQPFLVPAAELPRALSESVVIRSVCAMGLRKGTR